MLAAHSDLSKKTAEVAQLQDLLTKAKAELQEKTGISGATPLYLLINSIHFRNNDSNPRRYEEKQRRNTRYDI